MKNKIVPSLAQVDIRPKSPMSEPMRLQDHHIRTKLVTKSALLIQNA